MKQFGFGKNPNIFIAILLGAHSEDKRIQTAVLGSMPQEYCFGASDIVEKLNCNKSYKAFYRALNKSYNKASYRFYRYYDESCKYLKCYAE